MQTLTLTRFAMHHSANVHKQKWSNPALHFVYKQRRCMSYLSEYEQYGSVWSFRAPYIRMRIDVVQNSLMSYENNKTIYLCLFHFMFSVRLPCHSLFATFCLTFRPPERKVFYFGGVLYIFLFTEPWLSQTAQRLLPSGWVRGRK